MSISDTSKAQRYASVAEVAAAQQNFMQINLRALLITLSRPLTQHLPPLPAHRLRFLPSQ